MSKLAEELAKSITPCPCCTGDYSGVIAAITTAMQEVRRRDADYKELLREALTFIPKPIKKDVVGWKDNHRDKVYDFISRANEALK